MANMKVNEVPGGTIFHKGSDDYYLKTEKPVFSKGIAYNAIAFGTGAPAFIENELDQMVDTSECVFTQPD